MVEMEVRKVTKGKESNMVAFDFERTPITQIADYIIITASKNQASDIHFDPREDGMMVRFRIDGDLQDYTYIPKLYERNLTTRLKLLANMNITESRLPQDGAIKGEFGGKYLDMRVSCLPLNTGEKIVIRILDYSRSLEGIEKLGFNQTNLNKLKRMMAVPNGIILVTGATGSGKSTTVYSILQELNSPEINIITVEDPIEMNIEGLNQVQVNAEIGMTFAAALRSILRQDPNIILIGEIRDSETAQIAVRASITGHLVLSTIHTNNALSTIERLLDMDVERYLLSTALTGIIAQRLAKKLCPYCRIERQTTKYERKVFKKFMNRDIEKIYDINPKGCEHCRKGYSGRIAIHEVLELDDDIRYALSNTKLKKEELSKMVYGDKTITMLQDALGKAISGLTTFEEVYRVIELESDPEDDTAYLTKAIDDIPEENIAQTVKVTEEISTKTKQAEENSSINFLTPEQAKLQAEAVKQKLQEQTKIEQKITDLIPKPQSPENSKLVVEEPNIKPTIVTHPELSQPQPKIKQQPEQNRYQIQEPSTATESTPKMEKTKVEKIENPIPELNIAINTSNKNPKNPSIEESPLIEKDNTLNEKNKVEDVDINKISKSTDLKKENALISNPLKPTVKPVELDKKGINRAENIDPVIISSFDIKEDKKAPITGSIPITTPKTDKEIIMKKASVLPVINTEQKKTANIPTTQIPTTKTTTTLTTPTKSEEKKLVNTTEAKNQVLPVINTEQKKATNIPTTQIPTTKTTNTLIAAVKNEDKKTVAKEIISKPTIVPVKKVLDNKNEKNNHLISTETNKESKSKIQLTTAPTLKLYQPQKEKTENDDHEMEIAIAFELPAIKHDIMQKKEMKKDLENRKKNFITEMKNKTFAEISPQHSNKVSFITEMKKPSTIATTETSNKENKSSTIEKEKKKAFITEMKKANSLKQKEIEIQKEKGIAKEETKDNISTTKSVKLNAFNFIEKEPKPKKDTLKKSSSKTTEEKAKIDDKTKKIIKENTTSNESIKTNEEDKKNNKTIAEADRKKESTVKPKINIFDQNIKQEEKKSLINEEKDNPDIDLDNELPSLGED